MNDNNIQSFEVKPVSKAEVIALKQFESYTPEQRAELILIGCETLARMYQRNADKVTG